MTEAEAGAAPAVPLAIHVLTIHPEFIGAYARFGVVRAAGELALARVTAVDLRDYAVDKHGSVDAAPYGGGDGMVLRPEPLAAAVDALAALPAGRPLVVMTSPAGKPWTQAAAADLLERIRTRPLAIVCGRFGGVDERFLATYVDAEYSCGDVILTGGELPALMMIDAMLRLLPGALGHADSALKDSFAAGCGGGLEHPLYTRPPEFRGLKVPEVLLSGDHAKIDAWRRSAALAKTRRLRPDLLD